MQYATEELRAAVLMARVAACNAEVAGMVAANAKAAMQGGYPVWDADDFNAVAAAHHIHENDVINLTIHGVAA